MHYLTCCENKPSSFLQFARSLGHPLSLQSVSIDPANGKGCIECIDIEPGLQLRTWDVCLQDGLHIYREPYSSQGERSFTIDYYLNPNSCIAEDCQKKPSVIPGGWNTVLLSSDASGRLTILPGRTHRSISIHFTLGWLQENVVVELAPGSSLSHLFRINPDPIAIVEALNVHEKKIAGDFFTTDTASGKGRFFCRTLALNLLTAYFSGILQRNGAGNKNNTLHALQMEKVAAVLTDNIYRGLPCIKQLAKHAALSESTLKRYFIMIYGKNLSAFFLEKRMTMAKELLTTKNKTVNETAVIMGYENVSHFIAMFKKFFAIHPGMLRKKQPRSNV